MERITQRVTLALFAVYVALIPGSSLLVAFDQVPEWGLGFGGTLLLLQGTVMLAWLMWRYGRRGVITGITIALIGLLIEYIGETTGFPFGRYSYTDLVQPKLIGVVPLAICAAWLMSAGSAYEIARRIVPRRLGFQGVRLTSATLVLLLDMQIETVASHINRYWLWIDSGPYYGVPTANFVAWWLVGYVMSWVISRLLAGALPAPAPVSSQPRGTTRMTGVMLWVPPLLYLLSTGMFTIINLARGYVIPGIIGLAILLSAFAISGAFGRIGPRQTAHRRYD